MKKFSYIIATLLLLALCITGLISCSDGESMTGNVSVVVSDTEYSVDLSLVKRDGSTYNVDDVLLYLKENKNLHLKYTIETFGMYITEIGTLKVEANNEFIAVYTSIESNKDVSDLAKTITHNDTTLYNAGLGVGGLDLADGAVYLFRLETFS